MCSHKHEPDTCMWVHQNMSRLSGERDGVSLSKLTHSLSSALGIAGQCLLAVSSVKLDWKNMQYLLYNFIYFFRRWQMLKSRYLDYCQAYCFLRWQRIVEAWPSVSTHFTTPVAVCPSLKSSYLPGIRGIHTYYILLRWYNDALFFTSHV